MIAFFVIINRYTVVRQQHFLKQIKAFERGLLENKVQKGLISRKVSKNFLQSRWRSVVMVNRQIDHLSTDINRLNSIWSVHISIFFFGYIILVVYYAYSFLFIDSTWEKKAFFSIFFFYTFILLFLVIAQMASVVQLQVEIETINDRLCRSFGNFQKDIFEINEKTDELVKIMQLKTVIQIKVFI